MQDLLLNHTPLPETASPHMLSPTVIAAVHSKVEDLAYLETLSRENVDMKTHFADLFPDDIPHIDELPTDVYYHFRLKDPNLVIA
ncbi:hypothetical protein SCP_1100020 [Sparassis crispa]|uniref:Uncharacterized protein n=1 Tax=Sparassis crispa TaxID=139825 RepID=A0A401GYT3_9APHY|nr:hypothetical protein SCP_1100020 [Sparassis crispa]GBE87327.1 hypothetical protein SCP_1100020 [Sparassis crispa]